MALKNEDFKMKIAEWRGYVLRALEDIDKELVEQSNTLSTFKEEVNGRFDKVDAKIEQVDDKVNDLFIKVAALGGTAGVITGLITNVILSHLK